jgi:hypothetical protein
VNQLQRRGLHDDTLETTYGVGVWSHVLRKPHAGDDLHRRPEIPGSALDSVKIPELDEVNGQAPGEEAMRDSQLTLTSQRLKTPRAAAIAGIVFAVLFNTSLVLI